MLWALGTRQNWKGECLYTDTTGSFSVREANHGGGLSQETNSERNVNEQKHQKQKILLNTLLNDGPLI